MLSGGVLHFQAADESWEIQTSHYYFSLFVAGPGVYMDYWKAGIASYSRFSEWRGKSESSQASKC